MNARTLGLVLVAACATSARGQSLFVQALDEGSRAAPQELGRTAGAQASMLFLEPPKQRSFMAHDLVTIIVDETSKQTSSQSLDTKKEASADLSVGALVDPWALLELRLRQGELTDEKLLEAGLKNKFKGEGDYERSDNFNAKITAEIIEVKPNGTLVLQATKTISKDEEVQTLVLAGVARQEDITDRNTILSTQMANLSITVENEGAVRDAAKKGLLTRVMDAVFNF
jgi:flagellar L-ring protein precursor FlgH